MLIYAAAPLLTPTLCHFAAPDYDTPPLPPGAAYARYAALLPPAKRRFYAMPIFSRR